MVHSFSGRFSGTVGPRNVDTIGTYRKCPDFRGEIYCVETTQSVQYRRGVLISGVKYTVLRPHKVSSIEEVS